MRQFSHSRLRPISTFDRRIKARHLAPCLKITIRRPGLLHLFCRKLSAKCIDINRYGIGIECKEGLKAGDRVILDFAGKYICQSNIRAIVSNARVINGINRYGLVFSYFLSSKNYSRKEDNALSRIESLYNRTTNSFK
ncbi:MAG: PilZ domain-containing protein [Gammaproteobacteria bacterium]|nr:MAG: PilZ domain-containing protein [Pseudomonadota bacterium]PIE38993.1 MAG: PilZ domain-containing protein [Gammaproteobacteria bacterium]